MCELMMEQNFSELSKHCATHEQFICLALFRNKKSVFAERNIRSLKIIIHMYLEEKWTYSYIDKLDDFVKTINSRVKRITKLAPTKVKKDVPWLVSLSAETTVSQRTRFFVGDFVRFFNKDKRFPKGLQTIVY